MEGSAAHASYVADVRKEWNADLDGEIEQSLGEAGWVIKGRGRTGPQKPDICVKLHRDGHVRIDDANNLEFWLEFELPEHADAKRQRSGGQDNIM